MENFGARNESYLSMSVLQSMFSRIIIYKRRFSKSHSERHTLLNIRKSTKKSLPGPVIGTSESPHFLVSEMLCFKNF